MRNGRKRAAPEEETPPQIDRKLYSEVPLTPGGSQGRNQPLRRPGEDIDANKRVRTNNDFPHGADDNQQMENPDAQAVMRRGVYGPHDALDLLYKAATDTDRSVQPIIQTNQQLANDTFINSPMNMTRAREDSRTSMSSSQRPMLSVNNLIDRVPPPFNPTPGRLEQPIDPELGNQDPTAHPGYAEAIKAWNRFRLIP